MERIIVDKWNQNSKKLRKYYYSQIPQKVNKFHLHGKTFSEWFDYIVESINHITGDFRFGFADAVFDNAV